MEIRYEDLVRDTEPALRRVCEFIELEFDPVMLELPRARRRAPQEMNRDRAREGRRVAVGRRAHEAHAMTAEPPPGRAGIDAWKREMERRGPRGLRGVRG